MFELILGTTIVNAWVVYNMVSDTKVGILEFRTQLAEKLASYEETIERPIEVAPRKRTHTFVKPDGPGRKKRKSCKGCYTSLRKTLSSREADKKVRRVTSFCNECPNMPGFCLPCFNIFHK